MNPRVSTIGLVVLGFVSLLACGEPATLAPHATGGAPATGGSGPAAGGMTMALGGAVQARGGTASTGGSGGNGGGAAGSGGAHNQGGSASISGTGGSGAATGGSSAETIRDATRMECSPFCMLLSSACPQQAFQDCYQGCIAQAEELYASKRCATELYVVYHCSNETLTKADFECAGPTVLKCTAEQAQYSACLQGS